MRIVAVVALVLGLSSVASAETWLKSWDAHGRPVELRDFRGKVVALTFASKGTRDEVTEVNDELADLAGDSAEVLCVVDLEDVPEFGKGTARKKIAESDKPGLIQHVVDERGSLPRAFNVDARKKVGILVIDKNGELRGRFDGLRDLEKAQKLVEQLKDEPSRYTYTRRPRNLASEKR